ncbi:hypothetical protein MJO28_004328 [Puccinia striiformis f. sp. tritici]|uniref:Uncharacterized protein n=1 Tax=Puccinia striiformis f. sp. tritici TaxID=168172 RepID=A0ACC0EQS2_9BASI|nr:hypothetical protein MJO28_004328 [Puccinia striiformis f. sp. tritici]
MAGVLGTTGTRRESAKAHSLDGSKDLLRFRATCRPAQTTWGSHCDWVLETANNRDQKSTTIEDSIWRSISPRGMGTIYPLKKHYSPFGVVYLYTQAPFSATSEPGDQQSFKSSGCRFVSVILSCFSCPIYHVQRSQLISVICSPLIQSKMAILFSGGLDCTTLALLAHSHIPLTESIDLVNVAFEMPNR